MSRPRVTVAPHLDFAALTQRYQNCQDAKTRNHWLVILLLSQPENPMTIVQVAEHLNLSPDWVRKLVRRYNRFGCFNIGTRYQSGTQPRVQHRSREGIFQIGLQLLM